MYLAQQYEEKYRMKQYNEDYEPLDRFLKQPIGFDEEGKSAVFWPVDLSLSNFREKLESKSAFVPPGEQISGYTTKDGRDFSIYRVPSVAADVQANTLLRKAQFMALMYIDALNYIDDEDSRWEVFFVYESYLSGEGIRKYAFAGFTTVYRFYGHPHKTRLRISQVFIPPPFQHQGHGSKLLTAIYSYAKDQMKEKCLEVTVEDPNVEYQALRDRVDYRLFVGYIQEQLKHKPDWLIVDGPLIQWSKNFWEHVRDALKISNEQIRRCYELYTFSRITNIENKREYELSERARNNYMRSFRLDVKRRIYQIYDMKRVAKEPEQRKKQLEDIWVTLSAEYQDFFNRNNR